MMRQTSYWKSAADVGCRGNRRTGDYPFQLRQTGRMLTEETAQGVLTHQYDELRTGQPPPFRTAERSVICTTAGPSPADKSGPGGHQRVHS